MTDFGDIVTLKNRTASKLDFMWDAVPYVLHPHGSKAGKKAIDELKLPRAVAESILTKFPTQMDPLTGMVTESLVGIVEEEELYPVTPLDVDMKEWEVSDKSGAPKEVMVGGRLVKKERVSLTGK